MSKNYRFYCDDETGETVTYRVNGETGEPLSQPSQPNIVTSNYSKNRMPHQDSTKKPTIDMPNGFYNRKQFESLTDDIVSGCNTLSYRLLLIPASLFFPAFVTIVLSIMEVFLHVKCHKKNKSLKVEHLYYRSPFHLVTSKFCGVCRESESSLKVGLLQDRRRDRYDYLKGIVM